MLGKTGCTILTLMLILPAGMVLAAPGGGSNPTGLIESEFIGADRAWGKGITGGGIRVSVISSGVDKGDLGNMHPDLMGRIVSLTDYSESNNSDGVAEDSCNSPLGTFSAGLIAGTGSNNSDAGRGAAPGAEINVQRVVGDSCGVFLPAYDTLFKDAVGAGSTILKFDLGYKNNGNYTDLAHWFDVGTRDADPGSPGDQPIFAVVSGGNDGPGPGSISEPGTAKNALTVGSTGNPRHGTQDQVMSWSSRGPTSDGRLKPDVMAPGDTVYGTSSRLKPGDPYINMSGGVAAMSLTAGAAALVSEYFKDVSGRLPSPALLKALIINGAEDVPDGTPIPNMNEGWGRVSLGRIIYPDDNVVVFDQNVTLQQGESDRFYIRVPNGSAPLRVSLVWTDPAAPNTTGGGRTLINDLELNVTAPGGDIYRGNMFSGGWSTPNPSGNDSVNNVENIYIQSPSTTGPYQVSVHAVSVVADARNDTPEVDQDFALVISNGEFSGPPDTQAPVAKAPQPQNVVAGTTVTLDGSGSTDNVGVTNYTWTFKDQGAKTLFGWIVTYRFDNPGDFQVTLTVRDAAGNMDSDTTWVNVTAPVRPLDRVVVTPSNLSLVVGESITFTAEAYDTDDVQVPASITWDVEGGIGTILQNGTFTAGSPGSGRVSATARYNNVTKVGYADLSVTPASPTMGTLTGRVLTPTGDPVGGAKVTVQYSENSTVAGTTYTDTSGAYSISLLPGSYQVYAEMSGYTPSEKKLVSITSGGSRSQDLIVTPLGGGVPSGTDATLLSLLVVLIAAVAGGVGAFVLLRRRKRPAEGPPPPPPLEKRAELVALVHDEVCNDCQETIQASNEGVRCVCGMHYHPGCASSVQICPKCGMDLSTAGTVGAPDSTVRHEQKE